MKLPVLHAIGVPRGDPCPVLICLPDGTPIMAVADLSPDYDPMETARLVVDRVNLNPPVLIVGDKS